MSEEGSRGKFLWYELMTVDPSAAVDFYRQVVGWDTTEWEGGEQPYTMWTVGEIPVGGLMELPEDARAAGAPPHWLAYIGVPDVGRAVEKAGALGANVLVEPMEVPDVGRIAVLQDPQGAVFAVFTPEQAPPEMEGPPGVGCFSWHELATTDLDAAFDFYRELFGWEKTDAMEMGEAGTYQMYGWGDVTLGGMYNKPSEMPAPPHWLLYVKVDDAHQAAQRVREAGGQVLNGPMEVPGGDWVAQCLDPHGAGFAVHSSGA